MLNRTKGQLTFPARGEDLALERVVEVGIHAKQQIRIVTRTVNVADVPAQFSSKSKKCLYENFLPLFTILKRLQAA